MDKLFNIYNSQTFVITAGTWFVVSCCWWFISILVRRVIPAIWRVPAFWSSAVIYNSRRRMKLGREVRADTHALARRFVIRVIMLSVFWWMTMISLAQLFTPPFIFRGGLAQTILDVLVIIFFGLSTVLLYWSARIRGTVWQGLKWHGWPREMRRYELAIVRRAKGLPVVRPTPLFARILFGAGNE